MKVFKDGPVDRVPEFNGEHLWTAMIVHRIADIGQALNGETMHLDTENLILGPLLGCYWCEQPLAERLTYRKCKGEPS